MPWFALLVACGGGAWNDIRTAWLVDTLMDDNRVWLSRDPLLLASKYQVMAADPYDFMRGTASVFYRDLERTGTTRNPSTFVTSPEAASVLLIGDPHPENVGTMLPGPDPADPSARPALLFEHNDFDAAGFGPYPLDVRRAVLGMAVLLEGARCGVSCRERVLRALLISWFDGIVGGEDNSASLAIEGGDPISDRLIEDVLLEGAERTALEEVTTLGEEGLRIFSVASQLDASGNGLLAATPEERAQVMRLLKSDPQYDALRIHDIARRYGVGVASRPAFRYAVVYDRGDDRPDDDAMLQLREVIDPPALYTVPRHTGVLFDSNAQRILAAPLLLWSHPEADGRMNAVVDGNMTFKVQTWSSWYRSFEHAAIARWVGGAVPDEDALTRFAERFGALLACAHARSITGEGTSAGPVIVRDLEGRREAFVDELLREAEPDLARTLADYARFVDALDRYGPLLGAQDLGP